MRAANYAHCEAQIQRLSWLKGFPKAIPTTNTATGETEYLNPGLETLTRTLQAMSGDNAHATRIIEEVLNSMDACPTVPKLRDVALTVSGPKRPVCGRCHGDGWLDGYEVVSRDQMSGKSRLDRLIDKNEYERLAGEVKSEGEGRGKRFFADHTPGVIGTDTLAANFVMKTAIRCKCMGE